MPELITHFDCGITAIDTHYIRPGMDASHLIVDSGRAAFVDTGSTHSVPHLLAALEQMGIDRSQVDHVLLTHVHLDHAGGAGALMQALPAARAVIHPRGARHLIDPAKLIEGSTAVYGADRFRELYGEIVPIPQERVVIAEDGMRLGLGARELDLIHTPGHAMHHYCIVDRSAQAIFSGDTFGISYREFDTARGEFVFPTTSPVHLDPPALHASIDRLMSFDPRAIFLTHYSKVGSLDRLAADLHADLDAFVAIARRHENRPDCRALIGQDLFAYLHERLRRHGVELEDSQIHQILDLDVDINAQGLEVWLKRSQARSS